jgi:hypothetical protein
MFYYVKSAFLGLLLALAAIFPCSAVPYNPAPGLYAYGNGTPISPLYGGLLGSYAKALTSGTMAAGLTAASPVFSFRYGGTGVAVVKAVVISAAADTTSFGAAAGPAHLDLFAARSFTVSDSAGTGATLTGNNAKLRTSFATTAVSDIRISSTATLTAGTRTLDINPAASAFFGAASGAGISLLAPTNILKAPNAGDYTLVLAKNEGFVIQATVPGTGTWGLGVTVYWDEYAAW